MAALDGLAGEVGITVGATGTISAMKPGVTAAEKLALGLTEQIGNTDQRLLMSFASKINAKTYFDIYEDIFPRGGFPQLRANIIHLMEQAKEIHFNLDQIDKGKFAKWVMLPKDNGNSTNWELATILKNKSLSDKTTFYGAGGEIVKDVRQYLGIVE
jgi:hypothetical protein